MGRGEHEGWCYIVCVDVAEEESLLGLSCQTFSTIEPRRGCGNRFIVKQGTLPGKQGQFKRIFILAL